MAGQLYLNFDENRGGNRQSRPGARLVARQRDENPGVLWVRPAVSTDVDRWESIDRNGEVLTEHTTAELVSMLRYGTTTVLWAGSNLKWSPDSERRLRDHGKARGTGNRNPNTGKRRRNRRGKGSRAAHDNVWLTLAGKN